MSVQSANTYLTYQLEDGIETKTYDGVTNTLWDGRLEIDKQVCFEDSRPWSYRIKHAIFAKMPHNTSIPSTTLIQGPYGDLVNFENGDHYFSWYPVCMQGFEKNKTKVPSWNRDLSKTEAKEMASHAIEKLAEYVPSCTNAVKDIQERSVLGGIIYAQGDTDVEDPQSQLHERYQLRIKSKNGYYSVNPGKYSLCPFFANEAANRICENLAPALAN